MASDKIGGRDTSGIGARMAALFVERGLSERQSALIGQALQSKLNENSAPLQMYGDFRNLLLASISSLAEEDRPDSRQMLEAGEATRAWYAQWEAESPTNRRDTLTEGHVPDPPERYASSNRRNRALRKHPLMPEG